MTVVSKFGGSSLATAQNLTKVGELITSDKRRKFVVVSAIGKKDIHDIKITDLLISSFQKQTIDQQIIKKITAITKDLRLDSIINLDSLIKDIQQGIAMQDYSYTVSRGEYISTILLAHLINYSFVDAKDYLHFNFAGDIDISKSISTLQSINPYTIIPGFYGSKPNKKITLFSRGGSDTTGAIVSVGTKASLYENWTDVNGVYTQNPNTHKNAKPIKYLSYTDMYTLSQSGATILHPDSIAPTQQYNIPINIRNTFAPKHTGTIIAHNFNPSFLSF